MHRFLIIFLALFTINTTQAQKGYTVKVSGGIGSGRAKENSIIETGKRTNNDVSVISQIVVGYNFSNIRISTGLGLLGTAFSKEQVLSQSTIDPQTGMPLLVSTRYMTTEINRYIILPISAGYTWQVGPKLLIVPEIGLVPAHNMGIIYKIENTETKNETSKTEKSGTTHTLFSLSGLATLNLEYYVKENVGFTTGVTYVHTLTNLLNVPDTYVYKANRREQIYTINLGVIFRL